MKETCLFLLISLLLIGSFAYSNLMNDNQITKSEFSEQGSIQLGFTQKELRLNSQSLKAQSLTTQSVSTPIAVVVTITESDGITIYQDYNQKEIQLRYFNGNWVSEVIWLDAGEYKVTYFQVIDSINSVIYASSTTGLEYGLLVDQPLPQDLFVVAGQVINLNMDVYLVDHSIPKDFGYASFQFTTKEIFSFYVVAVEWDDYSREMKLVTANIVVSANGLILADKELDATTNRVYVQDIANPYQLIVRKGIYSWTESFSQTQMTAYKQSPLIIPLPDVTLLAMEMQSISTSGAYDWKSFKINDETWLAVANRSTGSTINSDSRLYKWNGNSFVEEQAIATNGASDWESFKMNGESWLAVANYSNVSAYNVDSRIYKWNGSTFIEVQAIATNDAYDWTFFEMNGETWIAVLNGKNGSTCNS